MWPTLSGSPTGTADHPTVPVSTYPAHTYWCASVFAQHLLRAPSTKVPKTPVMGMSVAPGVGSSDPHRSSPAASYLRGVSRWEKWQGPDRDPCKPVVKISVPRSAVDASLSPACGRPRGPQPHPECPQHSERGNGRYGPPARSTRHGCCDPRCRLAGCH